MTRGAGGRRAGGTRLIRPTRDLAGAFLAMAREYVAAGDTRYAPALGNFDAFLDEVAGFEAGRGLGPGRVPWTELWLVDGDAVVGGSRLRHRLTPSLERDGGHIGYDVRPSRRGRGYGHRILAHTLDAARGRGLARVLLTCEIGNRASARVIERAGGVPAVSGSISPHTGARMLRYWIEP